MSPLVILIAAVVGLIVLGAGAAYVIGSGRSDVDERMEQFVGGADDFIIEDVDEFEGDQGRMVDRLDKAMAGRGIGAALKGKIARSGVKLRVSEYLAFRLATGVGVAIVAILLFGRDSGGTMRTILGVVGGFFGSLIPIYYINSSAKKRLKKFDNQLSDTLNLWVNALRSGYSVLQGMEAIATELPPPVSEEFERVVQEVRLGLSVSQALGNLYRRVPSEDLDLVITAVNIQREVGGNLAEVLDTISFTIRERVRIKGEINTLTAQGRLSGWIISLLPIILGFILFAINPEYMGELVVREDPMILGVVPCGWLVIAFSLMMIGAGMFAIQKIVNIEV